MSDATLMIFHNPASGALRHTLALIRNSGVEPVVIEDLATPLRRAKLVERLAAMGVPVRDVLRQKGPPCDDLKLGDPTWADDPLIDFMVARPIMMNRPIAVTPLGTRLCRPSPVVLDFLPSPPLAPFAKEDRESRTDVKGRRVTP